MQAVVANQPGGPEALAVQEVAAPRPGPGQVLVRTEAVGVNFIDTYHRSGVYPVDFPLTPGGEGAGVVSAVGDGVDFPIVGDRVAWAASATGSYAQQVLLDAAQALPVPEGVSAQLAAATPLQGMTAHMLVDGVSHLESGQTILVHAGAGGVGLLLTQLAVARGARVITTVSTDEKDTLSRSAGASDVIRYDQLDDLTAELPALVRDLTQGEGVHVAYDGVGKDTFDASLASVRRRGLLVLFGGASGQVPPFDLQRLNRAGSLFVTRPTLFHYIADADERAWRAREIFAAVADGSLDVRIGARFPLADAARAHAALEGRQTTGKVLLLP
ncbi:quinone oxidoreductase [Ruania alkalisoli]|uniref:Quinone oxidoreductase n=1 Tax=Ruania alkalisoli TaxID=2779775 RepID=A0A7M1SYZ9_9MICO|nr:quinone oxidoreductase [Ruania alkalisoli]QOR72194.1 quinone oxidoreductase [Ruania alkalisoli]